ncbi:MAG: trypsin-like peptidase domain-containing protein [Eggerthellaceae bacterium]|nr:trypsin-like peptidase domain-containing protein [Eggerthellaceae bacterium]
MTDGNYPPQNNQNPYQSTYQAGYQAQQPQSQPQPGYQSQATHVAAPASQPKKNSAGKTFLVAFAGALVACVLAFGVAGAFGLLSGNGNASSGSSSTTLGASTSTGVDATDEDTTLAEAVAAKCLPSVAAIDVYTNASSSSYGYGSSSNSTELTKSSLGSGVVLSSDGYVITNYHVIEDGSAFEVTIDGTTYDADVVGSDPSSDIAVIKVKDASNLTAIELGDSDNLTIGEWVMSIGSPFGLEQSVATGIVSATSRSQIMNSSTDMFGNSTGEYTIYPNMIQTDAAINPGNSGGALVDAEGKLIGINTLITSYSGNYSGVGFAIPVNYAVQLAQQIIDGETPTHAQLGVSMTTINSSIASRYGFAVDEGAYVSEVTAGGGAEAAGIQSGDIITAFDGEAVSSASDLMLDVRSKNPGDVVTVTVNRDGQSKDFQVTLGSDESSSSSSTQQQSQQNAQGESSLLDMLRGGSGSSGSGQGSGNAA